MDLDLNFLAPAARAELEGVFRHIVDGVRRGAVDEFADARAGVRRVMDLQRRATERPPGEADPGI